MKSAGELAQQLATQDLKCASEAAEVEHRKHLENAQKHCLVLENKNREIMAEATTQITTYQQQLNTLSARVEHDVSAAKAAALEAEHRIADASERVALAEHASAVAQSIARDHVREAEQEAQEAKSKEIELVREHHRAVSALEAEKHRSHVKDIENAKLTERMAFLETAVTDLRNDALTRSKPASVGGMSESSRKLTAELEAMRKEKADLAEALKKTLVEQDRKSSASGKGAGNAAASS